MVQTVPKWKVSVQFADRVIAVWVYDMNIANVLRKIADMQFTENGLEQPTEIVISA